MGSNVKFAPLAGPVSLDDFAARLDALKVSDRFAIAVSGGRDSMALARLCADYANGRSHDIVALIVDHGLRETSTDEARQAKSWCEAAGLTARVLEWRGVKPASGLQAAARAARYFLLAKTAGELALPAILTAHSADDQAETVLMRLARGAGPAGLAGMGDDIKIAAGAGDPVHLIRPLLPFGRDRLTATVDAYEQPYVDDPSNEDPGFERVRMRAFLSGKVGEDVLDRGALLRMAKRMGRATHEVQTREARAFLGMGGVFTRWGGASVDLRLLSENAADADGLIARLIRAVSGADHAPDAGDAAAHLVKALASGAAALGGALLKASGARLWVMREPAAVLGRAGERPLDPVDIAAGGHVLWDKRFILSADTGVAVRPLGPEGVEAMGPAAVLFEGPRESLFALPGLYQGDRLIGAPGLLFGEGGAWSARPLAAERFSGGIIRFSQECA